MRRLSAVFIFAMLTFATDNNPAVAQSVDPKLATAQAAALIKRARKCSELAEKKPLRVGVLGFDIYFAGLSDKARVWLRRDIEAAFASLDEVRLVPIADKDKIIDLIRAGSSEGGKGLQAALQRAGELDIAVFFEGRSPTADQVEFSMTGFGKARQCSTGRSAAMIAKIDRRPSRSVFSKLIQNEIGRVIEDRAEIEQIDIQPFRFSARGAKGYNHCSDRLTSGILDVLVALDTSPNFNLKGRRLIVRTLKPGEEPKAGKNRYVISSEFGYDRQGLWIKSILARRSSDETDGDVEAIVDRAYITGIDCERGEISLFDLIESDANTDSGKIRVSAPDVARVRHHLRFTIRASSSKLSLYCFMVDLDDKAYVLVAGDALSFRSNLKPGQVTTYPEGITGDSLQFEKPEDEELFGCFGMTRPLPESVKSLWQKNFFAQPGGKIQQIGRRDLMELIEKSRSLSGAFEAYKRYRVTE